MWSGIPISLRIFQFVVIYTVKGEFNEGEVDVFLEFTSFFCDSTDVGTLISCSSAFSKSSLYIRKFLVRVLCFAESFHFCLRFKGFVNKIRHSLYTNK